MLVGCGKSPEEMVVGEWKLEGSSSMKLRADGVMEISSPPDSDLIMGEWKINGDVLEARYQKVGVTTQTYYGIDGPSKLSLFRITLTLGSEQETSDIDPPKPIYRVVE